MNCTDLSIIDFDCGDLTIPGNFAASFAPVPAHVPSMLPISSSHHRRHIAVRLIDYL